MWNRVKIFFGHGKSHILEVILKGLFWLAPIVAITIIIRWIYGKVVNVTGYLFEVIGLNPENFPFIWTIVGVALLLFIAYIVGIFVETSFGDFVQRVYSKIPGYETIKELINIFNTSKSGEQKVLVVLIHGFSKKRL